MQVVLKSSFFCENLVKVLVFPTIKTTFRGFALIIGRVSGSGGVGSGRDVWDLNDVSNAGVRSLDPVYCWVGVVETVMNRQPTVHPAWRYSGAEQSVGAAQMIGHKRVDKTHHLIQVITTQPWVLGVTRRHRIRQGRRAMMGSTTRPPVKFHHPVGSQPRWPRPDDRGMG